MNKNFSTNSQTLMEILIELEIAKYSFLLEENKNLLPFVEEVIVSHKDDIDMYLDMFRLETKIEKIEKGNFTMRINDKYLIVYDSLKYEMKEIVRNFLFKLKHHMDKKILNLLNIEELERDGVFDYLKNIVTFVNFILLFSPEFSTMYNLKKRILSEMIHKKYSCDDLIFSEFSFVNILNEKFRKCSISWDYRFFLLKNIISQEDKNYLDKFDIDIEKKVLSILTHLNPVLLIIRATGNIIDAKYLTLKMKFLLLDLFYVHKTNEQDKRNYHLWKYIVHIFNYFYSDKSNNLSELILIYSICLVCFVKNTLDYSAYSNFINFHIKLKSYLTHEELKELKSYLINISSYTINENNSKYLENIIKNYLN